MGDSSVKFIRLQQTGLLLLLGKAKLAESTISYGLSGLSHRKLICQKMCYLTLSALLTETIFFFFSNCVDSDETAHYAPSHQGLHCLSFCYDFLTEIPV